MITVFMLPVIFFYTSCFFIIYISSKKCVYYLTLLTDTGHPSLYHISKLYFGHKQMNDRKVSQFCISHEFL